MKLDASVTIRDRIDDLYRSDSRRVFASLVRLLKDLGAIPKSGDQGTIVSCFRKNGLHHFIARRSERFQLNWVRIRHERESDTIVAIFVFSYFRAFVIDSISSHHNSFHDKRRGVEVEEQAD